MTRSAATLLVLLLCLAVPAQAGRGWAGQVVRVLDGDSIVVRQGWTDVYVRLVDIDAPEKNQPYGKEATEQLRGLILNRRVRVAERGHDRAGRLLAEVFSAQGLSLNMHLVEQGRAWWFRKYAPECGSCQRAEEKARARKLGLWGLPDPVPPWLWRKGTRS